MGRWTPRRGAALTVVVGLLSAACASTTESTEPAGGGQSAVSVEPGYVADVRSLCGSKPVKVAFAKGKGDSWSKITLSLLKKEAAKCSNIEQVLYTDAHGDQTKALSDINGLVAQGVDILIVMAEFGAAELPAMRAAVKAGTKVIALIDDAGGTRGVDFTDIVLPDAEAVGKTWADWIGKNVPNGKVVFLGGVPGAQSSLQFFRPMRQALKAYPGARLVVDRVVDTNWEPGTRKQVMSGLLTKHGRIDVVVSDYGAIDNATLDAYKQAGMKLPALAAVASSNGTACYWKASPFEFVSVDGQNNLIMVALRKGLASLNKIPNPEPTVVTLPPEIDTSAGKDPQCSDSLPADASLGTQLSPAELQAIFK